MDADSSSDMDIYFGSNMSLCNGKGVSMYLYNITSPYTDNTNRAAIVGTSVAMFTLAVLFFNLSLFFRRASRASSTLSPAVRHVRSAALSLFLPVMSYLFSDAMTADAGASNWPVTEVTHVELPMRARLILTWMLLIELLRGKAWPMLEVMGGVNAEHAARIAWLGSLVFSSVQSPGRRAVFGVLWTIAAAKLVQRVAVTKVIRSSFAVGRNPEVVGPYTRWVLSMERRRRRRGDPLALTSCEFAVMGEEKIDKKTGPLGYVLTPANDGGGDMVTVGEVWRMEDDVDYSAANNARLKKLCLSFALFKLMRRRLEDLRRPSAAAGEDDIEDQEARAFRDLVFSKLKCEEVFDVVTDEVTFLSEHYHSVVPVVLASPFFLVANYAMFPIAVCCLCFLTVVACGYGDVPLTLASIGTDNYVLSFGVARTAVCLIRKVLHSPPALLCAIDLAITFFLFISYFYEELWEFGVFLLSDWFMVSLVCSYVKGARRRRRVIVGAAISCIQCIRRWLKPPHAVRRLKQLDVLRRKTSCLLPPVCVPTEMKVSAVDYIARLAVAGDGGAAIALQNGRSALAEPPYSGLSWACDSDSVAEVILTWHIATTIFVAAHRQQKGGAPPASSSRRTATILSRYCAYLVAYRPELLPDDWNDKQHVYNAMVGDLKKKLGCWGYYFSPERTRLDSLKNLAATAAGNDETVVRRGAKLGRQLVELGASSGEGEVWKVLAELWVELVVYVAPASDDAHRIGHLSALVEGGEFVTILWALAMHAGVTRPAAVASMTRSRG